MATSYEPFAFTGVVGKPLVRKSGRDKVTGRATFSAEWTQVELLHAALVPSTIARGRVASIDTSVASKLPGVRAVLTYENCPKFEKVKTANESNFKTCLASNVYPITEREIFFSGQYVAVVVADTFETARDAALQVKVTYEPAPHITKLEEAPAYERPKTLMGAPAVIELGDAPAELAAAAVKVDAEYPTMANFHNAIEPHATVAVWETRDGAPFLTVYDASQSLASEQATFAGLFGLKPTQVRVVCKYIGGAFGGKGAMWPHALVACMCAKVVGAPVKLVVKREQLYGGVGHRTAIHQRVAIGAKADGTITSIIHEGVASTSLKDDYPEAFTMATRMMYQTPALLLSQKQCRLDTQCPTFMRAPAETPGMFALESAIDELAVVLKMDPLDLRIKNEPAQDIYEKKPFSGRHLVTCLKAGAEAFGWNQRSLQPRSRREGNWLIGMGVAAATYPAISFPTTARVTLKADGTALIECCSHEMGTGTMTAQSQLLADMLGIPASRVSMHLGDTDLPPGGISGGSATTLSVGAAIREAVTALKQKLIDLAPDDTGIKGKKAADATFADGRLVFGEKGWRFEDLLSAGMKESVAAEGSISKQKAGTSNHSFGAQFIEVGVDEEFGLVRVRRMLGCFACGKILNAKTARSQFLGGMIMGLGHALMEQGVWDHRLGRVTNDNLAEYHIPVNADVPEIQVMFCDEPDFNASPIGAKGVGEIGITGVAAAVASAIFNATARRVRQLPITPHHVIS